MRTTYLPYAALIIFGLLISLFIIELSVRLFIPFGTLNHLYDPELEFRLPPNATYTETNMNTFIKDFTITRTLNEHGYNDNSHTLQKPENTTRILFMGDSFTYGYGVPREHNFVTLLSQQLLSTELINLGLPRLGTEQELARYLTDGIMYNPDAVILTFFIGNDLDQPQVLYKLENNTLIPQPQHPPPLQLKIRHWLASTFQSYAALILLLQHIPPAQHVLEKAGLFTTSTTRDIFSLQSTEEYHTNLAYITHLLKQFKHETNKRNTTFALVIIPAKQQIDDTYYTQHYQARNLTPHINRWQPQQDLKKITQKLGITLIDLTPHFVVNNINNTFYHTNDIHFNKKGHELTANILHKRIHIT